MKNEKVLPGFEPGLLDSKSNVITITLQDHLMKIKDQKQKKKSDTFSICACHPCAGAMLIFSVSFQFLRMTPIQEFQYN